MAFVDTSAITAKTPWESSMGMIPMHLDYYEGSMFDKVREIAEKYPNYVAFDFMNTPTTYRKMVEQIEKCAKALKTIGVRENDRLPCRTARRRFICFMR